MTEFQNVLTRALAVYLSVQIASQFTTGQSFTTLLKRVETWLQTGHMPEAS